MDNQLSPRALEMGECIKDAINAWNYGAAGSNVPATSEDIRCMANTFFISANQKPKGSGQKKSADVPREKQRGAPQGQNKTVGFPCGWCGQLLKQSKSGNAYCKCWYEEAPQPQQAQQQYYSQPPPDQN